MSWIFLDTAGMIALWDESDQWHEAAQHAYDRLKQSRTPLITTSYILLECGNSVSRRLLRPVLKSWRDALSASNAIIEPTDEDRVEAWAAFDRGEAGEAGIVDQVSFAVMRRLGLTQAFTNDRHFSSAGFETLF